MHDFFHQKHSFLQSQRRLHCVETTDIKMFITWFGRTIRSYLQCTWDSLIRRGSEMQIKHLLYNCIPVTKMSLVTYSLLVKVIEYYFFMWHESTVLFSMIKEHQQRKTLNPLYLENYKLEGYWVDIVGYR